MANTIAIANANANANASLRLAYCESERGLTSLRRGWRTPDPSPTREAAGRRSYAAELGWVEVVEQGDHSTPRWQPRALASESRGRESSWSNSETGTRTPSPSPAPFPTMPYNVNAPAWQQSGMSSENMTEKPYYPAAPTAYSEYSSAHQAYAAICVPLRPDGTIDANLPAQLLAHALSGAGSAMRPLSDIVADVPLPPAPYKGQSNPTRYQGGKSRLRAMRAAACAVSVGSASHPKGCGPPCKYAVKERGCKDGADCDHCHLCIWKPARKVVGPGNNSINNNKRDVRRVRKYSDDTDEAPFAGAAGDSRRRGATY
eukprot:TRINITY_DN82210_c0_g1_i1.p1 TRINITY_DN82210_c0_g1~~TRINITY_DN82210_c0_g1_i1.p1  ORF type:complete len:337 (-),score=29.94 TRINITY_DN82210_c0_g1_i1:324-1271(-)